MYFKFPNLCLHHIVDLDMFRESQYLVELDYLGYIVGELSGFSDHRHGSVLCNGKLLKIREFYIVKYHQKSLIF